MIFTASPVDCLAVVALSCAPLTAISKTFLANSVCKARLSFNLPSGWYPRPRSSPPVAPPPHLALFLRYRLSALRRHPGALAQGIDIFLLGFDQLIDVQFRQPEITAELPQHFDVRGGVLDHGILPLLALSPVMWAVLYRKQTSRLTDRSRKQTGFWLETGAFAGQKLLDDGRGFRPPRHHEEASVIDHPKLRVRNKKRQDAAVDRRNQPVIASHQDERRLRQRPKPRQARPFGHGKKLIKIPEIAFTPHRARVGTDQ